MILVRKLIKSLHRFIATKIKNTNPISRLYYKLDRMYLNHLVGKYLRPTIKTLGDTMGKKTYMGKTKINRVAVYIPSQDIVCSLNAPAHHHNVMMYLMGKGLWKYKQFNKNNKDKNVCYAIQGFLTDEGRFVQRRQAARIARAAKQVDRDNDYLFSEDMWSLSEDPRFESYFFRYK